MLPGGLQTGWLPGAAMPDANDTLSGQVAAALASLTGGDDAALLLAVSGGPDSMAMLDLVQRCWRGPVSAATVDHQLRAGSAAEAAMVADYCARTGTSHDILVPRTPIAGNLQSAARAVRYDLLTYHAARQGSACIVTAHHADDQLETVLMRLARGSGVDGLAGVRARNGQVIRPLLGLRKTQLVQHCTDHHIPFVQDPGNRCLAFDRVRMRDALERIDWIDPLFASRSAAALADAADALDWMAAREAQQAILVDPAQVILRNTAYPAALLRRLVLLCLDHVQPGIAPRGAALDRLIATLQQAGQAMIGEVLCKGGDLWRFSRAPARNGALESGAIDHRKTDPG